MGREEVDGMDVAWHGGRHVCTTQGTGGTTQGARDTTQGTRGTTQGTRGTAGLQGDPSQTSPGPGTDFAKFGPRHSSDPIRTPQIAAISYKKTKN